MSGADTMMNKNRKVGRSGRPNVVAIHRGNSGRTLMFEGHTAVVTEGDHALWTGG